MQLHRLAAIFGGYNEVACLAFLAVMDLHPFPCPARDSGFADGWDTLRSMIVGWANTRRAAGGDRT